LYIVQDAFFKWSHLEEEGAPSRIVIVDRHAKRGVAAFETLNDLKLYYYSNEPWLYPSTSARVKEFIELAESIANSHPPDLKNIDFRKTDEGHRASIRMSIAMPQVMNSLIEEFRTVLYPLPWYVRALEWLETRGKRDGAQQ
jgi:hypothetical protein